jgi:hypothetical protein
MFQETPQYLMGMKAAPFLGCLNRIFTVSRSHSSQIVVPKLGIFSNFIHLELPEEVAPLFSTDFAFRKVLVKGHASLIRRESDEPAEGWAKDFTVVRHEKNRRGFRQFSGNVAGARHGGARALGVGVCSLVWWHFDDPENFLIYM